MSLAYIGSDLIKGTAQAIKYVSPNGPVLDAPPRIAVEAALVRYGAEPGGYLHCHTDRFEPGGVVRFVFDDRVLVYRIESIEDERVVMEWPD